MTMPGFSSTGGYIGDSDSNKGMSYPGFLDSGDGIRFYAAASSPKRSRRIWAGLFVLRSGIPWNMLPREMTEGPGRSAGVG